VAVATWNCLGPMLIRRSLVATPHTGKDRSPSISLRIQSITSLTGWLNKLYL
jgi:hypothetical protein